MITIHTELTLDPGDPNEQPITLWMVTYGNPQNTGKPSRYWPKVVEKLGHFFAQQGWLLEAGDDPYREKSLGVFGEGFSWPVDETDETDESHYLPYGEPDDEPDEDDRVFRYGIE